MYAPRSATTVANAIPAKMEIKVNHCPATTSSTLNSRWVTLWQREGASKCFDEPDARVVSNPGAPMIIFPSGTSCDASDMAPTIAADPTLLQVITLLLPIVALRPIRKRRKVMCPPYTLGGLRTAKSATNTPSSMSVKPGTIEATSPNWDRSPTLIPIARAQLAAKVVPSIGYMNEAIVNTFWNMSHCWNVSDVTGNVPSLKLLQPGRHSLTQTTPKSANQTPAATAPAAAAGNTISVAYQASSKFFPSSTIA
mmetsp:Transcript_11310/g.35156  ORF Transcript_11310/g.35156 Transcript_11310/m.35156 type:complete len:253 (+) Transcript_11310:648-1406(+)